LRRQARSPSRLSALCPQSSQYSFLRAGYLCFWGLRSGGRLVGPASDTFERRHLFNLAFNFPFLLQIPQTGELLQIDPVRTTPVKGNSVDPCEDLDFHGLPSDLDDRVGFEKIASLKIKRCETKFAKHIDKAPSIFAADRYEDIDITRIVGKTVDPLRRNRRQLHTQRDAFRVIRENLGNAC